MATRTSLHIQPTTPKPETQMSVYPHRGPIVSVDLDGSAISICATDPGDLHEIAKAFTTAAHMLSDQIDRETAMKIHAANVDHSVLDRMDGLDTRRVS